MKILDYINENILFLDGGMGTLLQEAGLAPGEKPETWNIIHPEIITAIHKDYYNAGANAVITNTFGANLLKFSEDELKDIITMAVRNANDAKVQSTNLEEKFVGLDIGPLGKLLKPLGDLDFEDAVNIFKKTISIGAQLDVDFIFIETINDSYETKAALLAARETCDLPVFVSNAYGNDGKLMTGATPSAMTAMLEGMGAAAIGANCSLGPRQLSSVVDEYIRCSSLPLILKPNAGLPKSENGKTVYDISPEEFADSVATEVEKGVRIVGGCCGTTPEYIKLIRQKTINIIPKPVTQKENTVVSSYSGAVEFDTKPILIGERINPTGKRLLKDALRSNDMNYILSEALGQEEHGAKILDVNVGLPEINEADMLCCAVFNIQSVTSLPLQIDTSDYAAMEKALRIYNGKPLINSVNGKEESMEAVFPLQKKYGGVIIALTLDENGIPETVEGRVKIAEKIINRASEYGISKKDLIFDTLAMTVSADKNAAVVTLGALREISQRLKCKTCLGVSNVSFGLPEREKINSAFFALALENGLSAAIMNPYSERMNDIYYSFCSLHGLDDSCSEYIDYCSKSKDEPSQIAANETSLSRAIIKGLRDVSARITKQMLTDTDPLVIIKNEVIPALDEVGKGFEKNTVYLPQLLMSAEAAKSSFDTVKAAFPDKKGKNPFVIATVKGDIHDIGKNIVSLLLENYGFKVCDLGKDVSPEEILEAVKKTGAKVLGLSALMTTTVPAMEETIALIRKEVPSCKIIVGGAVLNKEYAQKIGADKYASDAMETVRYAELIYSI